MASYTDQQFEGNATSKEIEELMVAKAHELFAVCDIENKGFITKRDMQRLQNELPLNPDQLESVFDSLDDDGNGFLTLEEFTEGFGSFIGIQKPAETQTSVESSGGKERVFETDQLGVDAVDDEENFVESMQQIGATGLFEDQSAVKELWVKLRREEPEMLGQFEDFLTKITGEVKRTQADYENLETVLRAKTLSHEEEVQKLYEEMETQIKQERERILQEEKVKEKQLRDELERELNEKDAHLQEIMSRHKEMEKKLEYLNAVEAETKQENERLLQEKKETEEELERSQLQLEDTRNYVDSLRKQQKDEKKDRARTAFKISEGIALERESLVKQLDMLREMNKKLKDEKEESWMKFALGERAPDLRSANGEAVPGEKSESSPAKTPAYSTIPRQSSVASSKKNALVKQGSILSNYFDDSPSSRHLSANDDSIDEDIECDDTLIEHNTANQPQFNIVHPDGNMLPFEGRNRGSSKQNKFRRYQSLDLKGPSAVDDALSSDTDSGSKFGRDDRKYHSLRVPRGHDHSDSDGIDEVTSADIQRQLKRRNQRLSSTGSDDIDGDLPMNSSIPDSPRGQPVGGSVDSTPVELPETIPTTPERVFKVVFVGDSGVGKSSCIHRFCSNEFKETFSATIGVDFQMKNVMVDKHLIALQLWDTAGQERFRSITKQYFRKADGVVVMYDVTSEASFTNVRNWMASVEEGVEENAVVMLIGNKCDLTEDDDHRVVKTKDGVKLADMYHNALFFETSAKSGENITDSLECLSRLLRESEDKALQDALKLQDGAVTKEDKKGCCS